MFLRNLTIYGFKKEKFLIVYEKTIIPNRISPVDAAAEK